MLTAASASVLALAVGFAVNLAQLYSVKSGLRSALDAAVTSTARDLTTGKIDPKDARARFEVFLHANADCRLRSQDQLVLDTLVVDQTAKTVDAQPRMSTPTCSSRCSAQARAGVSRDKSAALYSDKTIEVAMMLDITGSMGGQKIEDLKTAANNALDAFLEGPGSQEAARARRDRALCRRRQHRQPCQQRLCRDQVHDFGAAGARRSAGRVELVRSGFDGCATERKGSQQFTDASPTTAMVNRDYRLEFCPGAALKPLSADIAALKKTIDSFNAQRLDGRPYRHPVELVHAVAEMGGRAAERRRRRSPTIRRRSPNTRS